MVTGVSDISSIIILWHNNYIHTMSLITANSMCWGINEARLTKYIILIWGNHVLKVTFLLVICLLVVYIYMCVIRAVHLLSHTILASSGPPPTHLLCHTTSWFGLAYHNRVVSFILLMENWVIDDRTTLDLMNISIIISFLWNRP